MAALRRFVTKRNKSNHRQRRSAARFLDSPGPEAVFSTEEERANIRGFVRKLLDAFVDASEMATNRFNLDNFESVHHAKKDGFFRTPRAYLGDAHILDRQLKQLYSLHEHCIEFGADCFARLLLPPEECRTMSRDVRIKVAASLDMSSNSPERSMSVPMLSELSAPPLITAEDAFRVLSTITKKFKAQLEAKLGEKTNSEQKWEPDWRCQAVVWSLVTSLGSIAPPSIIATPYQDLKEAAFACLFEKDYVINQWEKCSFRNSLLRFLPRPYNWDSDLTWVGVSFFVALPLADMVSELTNDRFPFQVILGTTGRTHQYLSFWVLTLTFFLCTAVGMVLFYAFYRSQYSKKLMRKAAEGTCYAKQFGCGPPENAPLKRTSSLFGMAKTLNQSSKKDSEVVDDAIDRATELDSIVTDGGSMNIPSVVSTPQQQRPRSPTRSAPALSIDDGGGGGSGNVMNPNDNDNNNATRTRRVNFDGIDGGDNNNTNTDENNGTNQESFPKLTPPTPPSPIAPAITVTKSTAQGLQAFFDEESYEPTKQNRVHSLLSPARAVGFADNAELPLANQSATSTLRLYQASMYVQRIYGSTYFDESWIFGLSEKSLYDAIKMTLSTDSTLGRQYAAFSFAAIAVSSRGSSVGSTLKDIELFNFGIFAFLACLTFVCGLTSAVLADQIMRQMTFSDINREGTAHLFANRFGFFIRAVGSLNLLAGMFLSTAILHFLLRIFKVNPYCVVGVGAVWLVTGSVSISHAVSIDSFQFTNLFSQMAVESFFANYMFWRVVEVLDSVTFITAPDSLSPSPLIGALQFLMAQVRRLFGSKEKAMKVP